MPTEGGKVTIKAIRKRHHLLKKHGETDLSFRSWVRSKQGRQLLQQEQVVQELQAMSLGSRQRPECQYL